MGDFFPNRALMPRAPSAEAFDRRLMMWGLLDFLCYVLTVYPIAAAYPGLFTLWSLTAPAAFLSTCMPVGPFSASYWKRHRAEVRPLAAVRDPVAETEEVLLAHKRRLLEIAKQAVQVETELSTQHPKDAQLRSTIEAQILQARSSRERIEREVAKIDAQVEAIRTNRIAAEIYLKTGQ